MNKSLTKKLFNQEIKYLSRQDKQAVKDSLIDVDFSEYDIYSSDPSDEQVKIYDWRWDFDDSKKYDKEDELVPGGYRKYALLKYTGKDFIFFSMSNYELEVALIKHGVDPSSI